MYKKIKMMAIGSSVLTIVLFCLVLCDVQIPAGSNPRFLYWGAAVSIFWSALWLSALFWKNQCDLIAGSYMMIFIGGASALMVGILSVSGALGKEFSDITLFCCYATIFVGFISMVVYFVQQGKYFVKRHQTGKAIECFAESAVALVVTLICGHLFWIIPMSNNWMSTCYVILAIGIIVMVITNAVSRCLE